MSDVTRRSVLKGVGATAAVVTAGVLVPPSASAATPPSSSTDEPGREPATTTTLVAHVSDASAGEITVLAGDREVKVTDRPLAQRLARLAD
jgi:hypothetical protein